MERYKIENPKNKKHENFHPQGKIEKKKEAFTSFPQRSSISIPLFLSFLFQPLRHTQGILFFLPLRRSFIVFSPAPHLTLFLSPFKEKKECRNYKQHLHFPNAFNVIFVNIRVSTGADLCRKIWKNLAMERIRYFHFLPRILGFSFIFFIFIPRVSHFFSLI